VFRFVPIRVAILALWFASFLQAAPPRDPSKWAHEIEAFAESDRSDPPASGAILFVGSSSIRLWKDLSADFPGRNIIQRGFGGAHLSDLIYYADRIILPYKPSQIVIYAGDNDIAKGMNPKEVFADFKTLVGKIQKALPDVKIHFLAIKPSPSRWHLSPQAAEANGLIRRYCAMRPKVSYIDVWTATLNEDGMPNAALFEKDSLHINRKGYEIWAKYIREALQE
jgi:lysophospholipase L1-like esterase